MAAFDTLPPDEQIKILRAEIDQLRVDMKNLNREAENFSSNIGKSKNILKDYKDTVSSMVKSMKEFTYDTGRQYKLAEQLAEKYKETSISIGLSVHRTADLSTQFKGAAAIIKEFGGDMGDVQAIYQDFADSSGRVRILGEEEVANIYKLGAATNLMGTESAQLFETLEMMGISNESASKSMEDVVISSQKIGLNSSKVMKELSKNMNSLQSYSFANGVKGMTEMAKQAVKMRLDIADVIGMADKFYQPEAAIEAAANLQMLGGDIAEAFGDPFETMYLARNKPEELAKRLSDMTENMLQFNEVTGEYELPAEARMQLKSAGDQLGIDVQKMTEMARQTAKLNDAKTLLSSKGMFTDEEMDGIGNMARMQDGQMVVDFVDENGEKQTKALEDLTSGHAEMILKAPQNEEDYMGSMLYEAQTTNQRLQNMEKAFELGFVKDIDVYRQMEESSVKTISSLNSALTTSLEKIKESFDQSLLAEQMEKMFSQGAVFDDEMSKSINNIVDLLSGSAIDINNPQTITIDKVTGDLKVISPNTTIEDTTSPMPNTTDTDSDFLSRNDGRHSSFTSQDDVLGAKKGGVIDKLLNQAINNTSTNTSPTNVNLNGEIRITGASGAIASIKAPELRKMVVDIINQKDRNGGTITSKQVYDS